MSLINFENNRWNGGDQEEVYRHGAILSLIEEDKILDYGCGDGFLLEKLADKNLKCFGVDVSEIAIEKCREKGLNASRMDANSTTLPFSDKEFELVIFSDVLEHLYAPEEVLLEAKRISENVLLSVPNFNSLPARIQALFGKIPENNTPKKGHVYWFNYDNLKAMLEKTGFKINVIETNTFWERMPAVKAVMKILKNNFPSLFALSFIVKASAKS